MSDVKFSQYELATLEAPRAKRLGFESSTKTIRYDWSDVTTSVILAMDSTTAAVVNTISSMKISGWVGYGASSKIAFDATNSTITGVAWATGDFHATNIYIGATQKDTQWDAGYAGRISSVGQPLRFASNVLGLSIGASMTLSGGTVLNVNTVSVTVHNDLTSKQGGATSEFYHISQALFDTLTANTINWTAAYNHMSSTGASHSYIDQGVTVGASPTFASLRLATGGLVLGDPIQSIQIGDDIDDGAFRISNIPGSHQTLLQIRNGAVWVTAVTLSI